MISFSNHRQRDDGTQCFGRIVRDDTGETFSVAVERPWKDNATDISCIPPAPGADPITYRCKVIVSPKRHFLVPEFQDVEHRDAVEFHPANWVTQLLGCTAPGDDIEEIEGVLGVSASRDAFTRFMALLGIPNVLTLSAAQMQQYVGIEFTFTYYATPVSE